MIFFLEQLESNLTSGPFRCVWLPYQYDDSAGGVTHYTINITKSGTHRFQFTAGKLVLVVTVWSCLVTHSLIFPYLPYFPAHSFFQTSFRTLVS